MHSEESKAIVRYLIFELFTPNLIYVLAFVGSFLYLLVFLCQKRFSQTNLADLISSGFQFSSIIAGSKLVLQVWLDLSEPGNGLLMDKLYCGYGGAAVVWIALVTLKKRVITNALAANKSNLNQQ